jgi:hypothetical protein
MRKNWLPPLSLPASAMPTAPRVNGASLGSDGQREAGAAPAGALRVAALDHEAGHDAVELQAVVEAALGQSGAVTRAASSSI